MATITTSTTACPSCETGPFTRNHYFTGKLLVERDFIDEQHYHVDKLRHHNRRLHGRGVVCGLDVKQHPNPDCRDRFVCIEPGTAIDCCGREIVVSDEECVDLFELDAVRALHEASAPDIDGDDRTHTLQICIRYRECPTEEIPVLYDDCGCDDIQCAPNRILESYSVDVRVDPPPPEEPEEPGVDDCTSIFERAIEGCPTCEEPDCIVLATIRDYSPGDDITDDRIDTLSDRPLLPSTSRITEVVRCILERDGGGGGGPGEPGPGIDAVEVTTIECDPEASGPQPGTASIEMRGGERTLVLEIPRGCDGEDGANGADGEDGEDGRDGRDGVGLERGLVRIRALSWRHRERTGRLLPILGPDGTPFIDEVRRQLVGVVIGFTDRVRVNDGPRPVAQLFEPGLDPRPIVDADHVFHVLAESGGGQDEERLLRCRCPVVGDVLPVEFSVDASGERITEAVVALDDPDTLAEFAPGVAWVMPLTTARRLVADGSLREPWVRLRGEFVTDQAEGRAIDAEFVRAELPTGDRPAGSAHGVQGGLFESWFTIDEKRPFREAIDVNSADTDALTEVDGIGRPTAERIVEERERRPFTDLEDFRNRVGPNRRNWALMLESITVRPQEE